MQHYRISFALACLWAIQPLFDRASFERDHSTILLFQFVPALLLGFFSRALLRWIGEPLSPPYAIELLTAWSAGAFFMNVADYGDDRFVSALLSLSVALVVTFQAFRRPGRGIGRIACLVQLYSIASLLNVSVYRTLLPCVELAIGSLVLLCCELSERICRAQLSAIGETSVICGATAGAGAWIRRMTRSLALALWITGGSPTIPAAAAAVVGMCDLLKLKPWRAVRYPGIAVLCLGSLWLQVGFLALALWPTWPSAAIVSIHAWGVGGLGLLSVGTMTSIVRRHLGRSLSSCLTTNLAYLSGAGSACCRLIATAGVLDSGSFIFLAKLFWFTSFLCCLIFVLATKARPAGTGCGNAPDYR